MRYEHGIISSENQTQVESPKVVESAIGVVIGTAPINLLKDPYKAVNEPILLESYEDAVNKIGFSYDFKNFTICQSIYVRFKKLMQAPIVVINVLDPNVHTKAVTAAEYTIANRKILISAQGILLDKIVVKSIDDAKTFVRDKDYIPSFLEDGTVMIAIPTDGELVNVAKVKLGYTAIDPTLVTPTDVIGGYNTTTRKRSGFDCISLVNQKLGLIPSQVLAPGWTQYPTVAAMLNAKGKLINSLFNTISITDIDTAQVTDIDMLLEYKDKNGYSDEFNAVGYPKVIVDGYEIYMSALIDGAIAYTDQVNDGPYASPSNKLIPIDGICLEGGEEIFYDIEEANVINSNGIVTALNLNGWRLWGNEMSCYPENTDVKDRYIVCRRTFNYQDNMFKYKFFDKVDDPTNLRLIESIVNAENADLASLATIGKIAGGSLSFNMNENSIDNIKDGHIIFKRKLSPFTPAKVIETVTEFDPTLNISALGGE